MNKKKEEKFHKVLTKYTKHLTDEERIKYIEAAFEKIRKGI